MKEKFYSMWAKATDKNGADHFITIVGKFTQKKVNTTIVSQVGDGTLFTDKKFTTRNFAIGRAICDPRDTFSVEKGREIATKRIEKGETIGELSSQDVTMLNDDMCNLLVLNELKYSVQNIDKFID
jgi:hypothetical protein